jgi:hypothetical protein
MSEIVGYKSVRVNGMSWYDASFGPWDVGATLGVSDAAPDGPCGRGIHVGKTVADAIKYGKFPFRLRTVRSLGPVLGEDKTKWRVRDIIRNEKRRLNSAHHASVARYIC